MSIHLLLFDFLIYLSDVLFDDLHFFVLFSDDSLFLIHTLFDFGLSFFKCITSPDQLLQLIFLKIDWLICIEIQLSDMFTRPPLA